LRAVKSMTGVSITNRRRLQSDSGGIPYATESPMDGRPSFRRGHGMVLLNELWPPRNPFNPDTTAWMTEFSDRSPMVR
jgi:hypothetical protein